MNEASRLTTFARLYTDSPNGTEIERVEIPLIQRDYAQGRTDARTTRVRSAFLEVLQGALVGDAPESVGLDFIYGDVDTADGALRPLDGQQRLTTLFLLHWYIAHRVGVDLNNEPWTQFSYATRPGARLFCERLVQNPPPSDCGDPANWIRDQAWFQYVWRHDPTIQSMLTMIVALHERFAGRDVELAWRRLTNLEHPAISFHVLPIRGMGSPEDLYIRMNSRGKPLTEFENFKARLESIVDAIDSDRELAHKIDGAWADLFWSYRGDDDLVDDEMLRYLGCLIELCEWRDGTVSSGALDGRARELFDGARSSARDHLRYVINAFDTWLDTAPSGYFDSLFTREPYEPNGPVRRFMVGDRTTDLFLACVNTYGESRGKARVFTFGDQLLLAAILAYRMHVGTVVDETLRRRIRIVRNLINASENELRLDTMPKFIAEVEDIAVNGVRRDATTFNRAQFDDERRKIDFLTTNPELASTMFALEDHDLIRGSLAAFDLDPDSLSQRANAFRRAFSSQDNWTQLTGALLATGPYPQSREKSNRSFQFGAGRHGYPNAWRALFAASPGEAILPTRSALATVLDSIAEHDDVDVALATLRHDMCAAREEASLFDWRYYLVKYDAMREGRSGVYITQERALGYDLCMLNKYWVNSNYRDPYLLAICRESGVTEAVDDPWFTGYEWNERYLTLRRSGTGIRNVNEGFFVAMPTTPEYVEEFKTVVKQCGLDDGWLRVPQRVTDDGPIDETDRIQVGAKLVRTLVSAGL